MTNPGMIGKIDIAKTNPFRGNFGKIIDQFGGLNVYRMKGGLPYGTDIGTAG